MLNPIEEQILRNLAREIGLPRPQEAPRNYRHPDEPAAIRKLYDDLMNLPKLAVKDLNSDVLVEMRLSAAGLELKPGEAYTLGLSRHDIVNLPPAELKARVVVALEQAREDGMPILRHAPPARPAVTRDPMVFTVAD